MPISADQEAALTKLLLAAITYHQGAAKPFIDKAEAWLALYNVEVGAKTKPWPGASNFPVPFVAEKMMSIHARLVRAIFNVDPIWIAKARMPAVKELAPLIENYVDYLVDRGSYRATLDMAILYSLIQGTAVVKIDYERVTKKVQSSNPSVSGQVVEEFVEFEGPRASYVPLQDFIVLPLDRPDMDKGQGCGHRFYLSRAQLQARGDAGIYDKPERVLDMNAKGTEPKPIDNPMFGTIPTPPITVIERFELFEMFWRYDIDGSGEEVPCLITFSKAANVILRCIKFPYDHGKPPYVAIRPIPTPNLFYGTAFTQYLEPIQKELTASYQRRADALARATMPPILRQRGSAWNPNERPLAPGEVIDVNDPAGDHRPATARLPPQQHPARADADRDGRAADRHQRLPARTQPRSGQNTGRGQERAE